MRRPQPSPLLELPVLDGVPSRERRALARFGTTVDRGRGAILCREGVVGEQIFIVIRGVVTLSRDGVPRSSLHAGDVWVDCFPREFRADATAVATTPVCIHVFSVRELRDLENACPVVAGRLLRTGNARMSAPPDATTPQVPARARANRLAS